jgi:hypothetical protein
MSSRSALSGRLTLALALPLAAGLTGCVRYEFDHEFWLDVDGSGSVQVTGRPGLWVAFKGLRGSDPEAIARAAHAAFERSGLRVRRVRVVRRAGNPYVFLAAEFPDVNALGGSAAFPDLALALRRAGERLRLEGSWARPPDSPDPAPGELTGLVAVRFHMPSRVHSHDNAAEGVERGNILTWRTPTQPVVAGRALAFGADLDARSTLWTTVLLFAAAIALALLLLAGTLVAVARRGRRQARDAS